jgi:hypothetical protein
MIDIRRIHQEPREILCDAHTPENSLPPVSDREQRRARILRFFQDFSLPTAPAPDREDSK